MPEKRTLPHNIYEQLPEISDGFWQAYLFVIPKSFVALLCVCFLVTIGIIVAAPAFGALMFLFSMLGTFLCGLIPVATLGAGTYAYYLITPDFGLRAVFLVSLIPGLLFVLLVEPEYWFFWLGAGPVFGLFQHLVVRESVSGK